MMLDRGLAEAALAAGASGFVPKDAGSSELQEAIEQVLAGLRHLSPRVPKASHCVSLDARHLGLHRLTPRQQEIVLLLGEGRPGAGIARALGLSPSTITFHKRNIMRVHGIDTEAGLLRYAVLVRAGADTASIPMPDFSQTARTRPNRAQLRSR